MVILESSLSFYFLNRYFLLACIKSIIDDPLVLAFHLLEDEDICNICQEAIDSPTCHQI